MTPAMFWAMHDQYVAQQRVEEARFAKLFFSVRQMFGKSDPYEFFPELRPNDFYEKQRAEGVRKMRKAAKRKGE